MVRANEVFFEYANVVQDFKGHVVLLKRARDATVQQIRARERAEKPPPRNASLVLTGMNWEPTPEDMSAKKRAKEAADKEARERKQTSPRRACAFQLEGSARRARCFRDRHQIKHQKSVS